MIISASIDSIIKAEQQSWAIAYHKLFIIIFSIEKERSARICTKSEFLKFDFTNIINRSGLVRPQCVYCLIILSNKSMEYNKLKRHLNTVYPIIVDKLLCLRVKHQKNNTYELDRPSNLFSVSLLKTTLKLFLRGLEKLKTFFRIISKFG